MKKKIEENYLEKVPVRSDMEFTTDSDGKVTLHIENKGVMNKFAQFVFKKPKVSYIHLDEMGSFIWQHIDGQNDVIAIGECVKKHFGEKAEPLYERLAKYIQTLESYKFIQTK